MDSAARMVGRIQKNMGMTNVRHVRDIYNVRQDTLERRLTAAKGMSPGSRMSIYTAWLQHRICDKSSTCNNIQEADTLCSVAVRLRCTEDMLRHVWKDCVRRAATDLSSAEKERVKEICEHLDQEISKWFKGSHRHLSQAPVAERPPAVSARRDPQPWRLGALVREAPEASTYVEESPIAAPDNWGMVPDEWYECPNCGETGTHYAQYCPNIHHALGPMPRHDPRPPPHSGPSQGVNEGRVLGKAAQTRSRFPVGGQGGQRTIAIRETTRLQSPDTGSWARAWSPEPGEVDERQTSQSNRERTVLDQRLRNQSRKRSRGVEFAAPSGEGSSCEVTEVRRPDDHRDDLFADRLVASSSRHKRTRHSGPDADNLPYYLDTERAQPLRNQPAQPPQLPPEPVEERVGRWRSDVLASSQEAAKESNPEPGQNEPDPEQASDGDDEISVVINTSARPSNAQRRSLAPAIEPPATENESSSPEAIPFHTPIRSEQPSSPLQTFDVTARPRRLPVRAKDPLPVRGFDEVIIKPECEDITDMINAQEAAETFLDRLSTSLDADELVQVRARREYERSSRAMHSCPKDKLQEDLEMDVDSGSEPVETGSGAGSSCVDADDNSGSEEGEPSPCDFDRTSIEAPHVTEPQYTLPVLLLFRGQAPPQLSHMSRAKAVDMWESADSDVSIE